MEQTSDIEIVKTEAEIYLEPGPQTQITPEIEKIASEINGTVLEKTQKILETGATLVKTKGFDEEVFRQRTGAQIIQDKYITGCTDAAIAFITVARATGIPCKYVETIDKEWLEQGGSKHSGHVYVRIYDEGKDDWILIDPMKREIDVSLPPNRVIYKEGLDSWDIGITDFKTLQKEFERFRETWRERQEEQNSSQYK